MTPSRHARPRHRPLGALIDSDAATPLSPSDPSAIGDYRLVGRIGSGGMGTVYMGVSPEGRHVAVKVIRAGRSGDPGFTARFASEVEHARAVASFCTAQVLGHGETPDGRPYMVTEYIPGTPLDRHIATDGPLEPGTLHGVAFGVAAALTAIHAAGLVHRDLKPSNVILSMSGPRVIDFGISRAVDATHGHTGTDELVGTPGWWAPEQLRGLPVTPAADVFTWGCLVAYAAGGRHPFGEGDPMVLAHRLLESAPDLGTLPAPLDRLVRRALDREPRNRPTSQELLLDLVGSRPDPTTQVIEGPWDAPSPHPSGPRPRRRTGRLLALVASAVALAIVAGLAVGLLTSRSGGAPPAARESDVGRRIEIGDVQVVVQPPACHAPTGSGAVGGGAARADVVRASVAGDDVAGDGLVCRIDWIMLNMGGADAEPAGPPDLLDDRNVPHHPRASHPAPGTLAPGAMVTLSAEYALPSGRTAARLDGPFVAHAPAVHVRLPPPGSAYGKAPGEAPRRAAPEPAPASPSPRSPTTGSPAPGSPAAGSPAPGGTPDPALEASGATTATPPGDAGGGDCARAGAADFDGDGYDDAVVTDPLAPSPDSTAVGSGRVFLLRGGPPSKPAPVVTAFDAAAPGWTARAAHIDGDRCLDLVVSTPYAYGGAGQVQAHGAGVAYVYWGGRGFGTPGAPRTELRAPEARTDAHFGWSLAVSDTSPGSGHSDGLTAPAPANTGTGTGTTDGGTGTAAQGVVVVGAPHEDADGEVDSGAVYVYRFTGRSPGTPQRVTQDSPGVPGGSQPGDMFGWSLALGRLGGAAGPLDLAVGAPFEDQEENGQADTGAVTVIYDVATRPWAYQGAGWSVSGLTADLPSHPGDRLGYSLAYGAGYLAVGAPGADPYDTRDAGAVLLLQAAGPGPRFVRLLGAQAEAGERGRFGFSLALAGPSLLAGAPGQALPGVPEAGAVHVIGLTGPPGRVVLREDSPAPYDHLGWSVSGTADGRVLAGAPDGGVTGAVIYTTVSRAGASPGSEPSSGSGGRTVLPGPDGADTLDFGAAVAG
ncbi:protein kinase domain-containing protein [Microbispora sp. H10949]|uniref:protein kinase domain-containing protein n=1 Tax=Microbispora sp. H10949 TaxID=2729111 RepID=UPI0016019FC8